MEGYRELTPAEPVRFAFETVPDQDGYKYRATQVWPIGAAAGAPVAEVETSSAYGSNLRLYYDAPDADTANLDT